MILHKSISSFPERYAAPVAHVIAGIEGSNATQFLVDHDDRERVTGTVVLNLWCCLLTNGQDDIIYRFAICIYQLVFSLDWHEMNLSHTNGRNHVHRPAELELHAARTRLSIKYDSEIGTCQFILILAIQKPTFTLALVFCLLGISHITLERILYLTDFAFYIGRNQTLESTLIV